MVSFRQKGDFTKTFNYFRKVRTAIRLDVVEQYAEQGVQALASATPVDTGTTANSWYYKIERTADQVRIVYCNSHINQSVPIAIILQYGHGTGTGGWVQGRDYINPAIQPIFDSIANNAWKEVTSV